MKSGTLDEWNKRRILYEEDKNDCCDDAEHDCGQCVLCVISEAGYKVCPYDLILGNM